MDMKKCAVILLNMHAWDLPVLVLLCIALWFTLRGDLFYVLPCVILFLCFFSPFSIAITLLGEERANLSAFLRLFDLCLFRFVGFLFLLVSGKGCGFWLWHSLDFSLTFFCYIRTIHGSIRIFFYYWKTISTNARKMSGKIWNVSFKMIP